jgi:hypothetical protein
VTGEIIFAVAAAIVVALLGAAAIAWCNRPVKGDGHDRV